MNEVEIQYFDLYYNKFSKTIFLGNMMIRQNIVKDINEILKLKIDKDLNKILFFL
jgi:NADPH-dependent 7-cyano-7-deazaguanine reductase QueF-like protein